MKACTAGRSRSAVLAAALLVSGCRGDKKRAHEGSDATPSAPVCAALSREAEMTSALEALLGEYFVLKYATKFDDHAEIAARARAAGGQAASFFEQPILIDGPNGAISAILDGRDDLERLRPYVEQGSFDRPGEEEVALGAELARQLGASVGAEVELFAAGALPTVQPPPIVPPRKVRVVALLSFPGEELHHYGGRFVFAKLSSAQRMSPGEDANITGVRVYSGGVDSAKPERWLSSAREKERYRTMSVSDLNGSTLDWNEAAVRAACKDGPPPSLRRADALSAPHACEVSADLRRAGPVLTRLFGALREDLPRASEFEAAAKRASATRIARRIELDASVVTTRTASPAAIFGVEADDEGAFEGLVVSGSIQDVLSAGKVALGDRLAASLGVEPGDEVFVRARRSGAEDEPTSFRTRVGAVVKLPANPGHVLSDSTAWMSGTSLREQLHLAPDAATSVVAWASDPAAFQEAMAKDGYFVKGPFREPALLELARLLEEACRQRGRP